jgi:hypothetical protein
MMSFPDLKLTIALKSWLKVVFIKCNELGLNEYDLDMFYKREKVQKPEFIPLWLELQVSESSHASWSAELIFQLMTGFPSESLNQVIHLQMQKPDLDMFYKREKGHK